MTRKKTAKTPRRLGDEDVSRVRSGFEAYQLSLRKMPRLSPDQTLALCRQYRVLDIELRAGPEGTVLRDQIILGNQGFVVHKTNRFLSSRGLRPGQGRYDSNTFGEIFMDCVALANEGMLSSLERYDPNLLVSGNEPVKFVTFAGNEVDKKLDEFLFQHTAPVAVGADARISMRHLRLAEERLRARGETVTDASLAAEMTQIVVERRQADGNRTATTDRYVYEACDVPRIREQERAMFGDSLDSPVAEDEDGRSLGDLIEDERASLDMQPFDLDPRMPLGVLALERLPRHHALAVSLLSRQSVDDVVMPVGEVSRVVGEPLDTVVAWANSAPQALFGVRADPEGAVAVVDEELADRMRAARDDATHVRPIHGRGR